MTSKDVRVRTKSLFRPIGRNTPRPKDCPKCHRELDSHDGMVGEEVLVCAMHGIVWEDAEDAVRRVI